MAIVNRTTPDEIENPVPHGAVRKTVVDTVLDAAVGAGSSVLSILSGVLAAMLILYSGYVLYDSFYTMNSAYSNEWDLMEYKPEIIEDGATPLAGPDVLAGINNDYRSWLTLYDTSIDYPVVQGSDDLYYASHDYYGNSSLTGAIYLAAGNDPYLRDSYNIVYGHHMDNDAMFGSLDYYRDTSYVNSHRTGLIIGRSGIYDLNVFAVAEADAYESNIYSAGNRAADVISFLASGGSSGSADSQDSEDGSVNGTIATSILYFDEAAAAGATKVLAMSTCASATTNGRLIVFATMTLRNIIMVAAESYEGTYDGQPHGIEVIPSTEDAVITYSIDGGTTWTTETPLFTNVGEYEVLVRASSSTSAPVETTATVIISPREVVVTADNLFKLFGTADPELTSQMSGLLDGDIITYSISREAGENVGTYDIYIEGETSQGNYTITFVPGTLTIVRDGTLALTATGYTGVYDGEAHYATANVNIEEGTTIEFSTDGGVTWTTQAPYIIDPGVIVVQVRASNPNYDTVYTTVVLTVTENILPEDETSQTVVKIWDDNNDASGQRPASVYVVLMADGASVDGVTLSAGNGWSATISGLPVNNDDGTPVSYTWAEGAVNGYSQTAMTSDGDLTTITNSINAEPVDPVIDEQTTLTINYIFPDGTQASLPYTVTLNPGDAYSITSPVINGYTASVQVVEGIQPGYDAVITVVYVPDATPVVVPETIVISDFATPLGLGDVYVNTGECKE